MRPSQRVIDVVLAILARGVRVHIDPSADLHGADICVETDDSLLAITWEEIDRTTGPVDDVALSLLTALDQVEFKKPSEAN